MSQFNPNQMEFIQRELAEWAIIVELELKKKLHEKNIHITGDLENSLTYQVFVAGGGNSGRYQLSFLEYGRMVDMGKGRIRKTESIAGNTARLKGRKPEKWYAKTAYVLIYGNLIRRLQNNYQEAIIYTVKQLEHVNEN